MAISNETWKTLAIIFFVLLVVTNVIFISGVIYGMGQIEKEENCGYSCVDEFGMNSYYWYDGVRNVCECYLNNEMVKREVIS